MASSNIASILFDVAESQPDVLAIAYPQRKPLFGIGKTRYAKVTFAELAARVRDVASGLRMAGFERGDRVVLLVPPSIDFFVLCYALLRAGVVPVVIDPGIGAHNLKQCVGDVDAVGFISVPKAHAARVVLGWGRGSIRKLVTVGRRLFWGGQTLREVEGLGRENSAEIVPTAPDETAAIVFTSGSTGPPKGVIYSHANFYAQLEMLQRTFDAQRSAVDLPTFPPFALFNPAMGVTSIIPDMDATKPGAVDPRKIFSAIETFGVTTLFGSPALMRRIASYGIQHGITLPSITRAVSAGAPMPADTLRMMAQLLPQSTQLFTPYGATEGMPISIVGSAEILAETQQLTDEGAGICVGLPVEGVEVEVIAVEEDLSPRRQDAKGREDRETRRQEVGEKEVWDEGLCLGVGEVGEVVVKGRNVTRAYFRKQKANRAAKFADGETIRHRMGDVGYKDAQGRLWYCGRKAHIVRVDGQVLYSVQCEAIFNKHPAVLRTALVEAAGESGIVC